MASLLNFLKSAVRGYGIEVASRGNSWLRQKKDSHKEETCFVFGNGPSLKDFPFSEVSQYTVFGTNGIYLIHIPDYYVTISNEFYRNHIDEIKSINCRKKLIGDHLRSAFPDSDSCFLSCNWNIYGHFFGLNFPVPLRFSKRADRVVYLGGSVIFVCLQLAFHFGFKKVLLAGVDHRFGFPRSEASYGGRRIKVTGPDLVHFDPQYNPIGHSAHCDMLATERSFSLALDAFSSDGREIINVTPNSGLDVVPSGSLEDVLE